MDKILSINTIKNVFSALGAKTSDDNYGVALLDKTSGEPKGLMGMSDLASVLGSIICGSFVGSTIENSPYGVYGVYELSRISDSPIQTPSFGLVIKAKSARGYIISIVVDIQGNGGTYAGYKNSGAWEWKKII